jgi:hypothetical protein
VAIGTEHSLALPQKRSVRISIVLELGEPLPVRGRLVIAHDSAIAKHHVLVHTGIRGIGHNYIDRRVRQAAEEGEAISTNDGVTSDE